MTNNELMTTAVLRVRTKTGRELICRTLLDTCSTANFITEEFARTLQLPRKHCSIPITVLNSLSTTCKSMTTATIQGRHNSFEKTLNFLIIPHISSAVPNESFNRKAIQIPSNIKLADPNFHKSAPVQMLLGAGPTLSLLSIGQINLSQPPRPDLILQKTLLGWIIGGEISTQHQTPACYNTQVHFEMSKFWTLEEPPSELHLSPEEAACENHFKTHTTRTPDGRYIVTLPFKENCPPLGDSYSRALKRFQTLERMLNLNPTLKEQYSNVIQEYLTLGHMSRVNIPNNTRGFYLPHHAVLKESSQTTKVRVVFDGSAKTTTGVSLNDILMVGPTIQDDIISLLLRFRLHNYVITGDIEKMYRQFLIRRQDRAFQKILWRDQQGNLTTYELNTVTFGLSAAPFLAIRCIHQLAEDESLNFPTAAKVLQRDLYVDDLITGTSTLDEARTLRDEIIELLQNGGIHIRQWASNAPELLDGLPEGSVNISLLSDEDNTLKTLGVSWNSRKDLIVYSIKSLSINSTVTKRTILADVARIFDPLGLLGPVIVLAKILLQQLWLLKLDWDESVPLGIHTTWTTYCEQLSLLNDMTFPRKLALIDAHDVQLHGFCDASEKAYGACIYLRTTDSQQRVQCRLFCAKSRVAPLKVVSLPRLELCGALLLSKLYQSVIRATNLEVNKTIFWTDSTITLHWINTQPFLLKTFVANRVAEIRNETDPSFWRHIPSEDNPADILSRGQLPAEFIQQTIWKNGPVWITEKEFHWPCFEIRQPEEIPETRKGTCLITNKIQNFIIHRYSNFSRLMRIVSYCLRFRHPQKFKGSLQPEELENAHTRIIKLVQEESFRLEIKELQDDGCVSRKSKLITLNPFLDDNGLIRVGGRLKNSTLEYSQKHPIALPRSHYITTLIIRQCHEHNLHTGVQSTLNAIRQRYWPLNGRNQVRKVVRECVKCFRTNPPIPNYVMADLPSTRITEARPFSTVGIDYCGPFFIKEKKFRNQKTVKVYVAVFICLVIKAIHLEVVSDMTTEGFLGALRRFIARRGKCNCIYSDNGTNFVGANNELKELSELLTSKTHHDQINHYAADEELDFRDTPCNRLSVWQHIQKIRRDFWVRWHKEYLNELTVRQKWTHGTHQIKEGTLVVLREDNLPPLQWKLGRIIQTHPGSDGITRTVTVKTINSTVLRNVRKLSPLPFDDKI